MTFLRVLPFMAAAALLAQDEKQPAPPKEEIVEIQITVGKRATDVYNLPGFKVKDPLTLAGQWSEAKKLRELLKPSMAYILSQQAEDGSWNLNQKQLRPGASKEVGGFLFTAQDSVNKVVMTCLCGLALRAHQEFAPQRIEEAVQKGLAFVIENAPKHKKARYGVWTWSFSIIFLVQEYQRSKDDKIKEAVKGVVEKLLQNQHKGLVELPKEPAKPQPTVKRDEGASRDKKDRQSNGGFFGVVPSDEDEIGKEGALVMNVDPKGPAGTGGMKGGDRILEIDGIKVESVNHLYDVVDSLKPTQVVKVKVLRVEGMEEKMKARFGKLPPPENQNPLVGKPPEDGAWSYYQTGAVTFGTSTAIMALLDARSIGVDIPQDSLDRAIRFVESQQIANDLGEESYTYTQGGNRGPAGDIRGAIGRVCACELAMQRAGKHKPDDLKDAVALFVKRRGELDRVRGYPGNHFVRSFMNAAYYFLYGHYYSAKAVGQLKDPKDREKYGAFIQEALLKIQHPEGTWTDHEAWGQLYGTAMAMMAMGELKSLVPLAYKSPIAGLEKLAENEY
jgi:hypothetical protein